MKPYLIIFIVFIFVITVFCSLSFATDRNNSESEYIIGIGDVVQISVWQNEQFNGIMTVGPDGKITIPLLGDIIVADRNRKQVKDDITSKLSKFIKEGAEVTVSVTQFNSQKIFVFGRVMRPSTITFQSPPSLLEIMIQAEPAPDADLTSVKVIPVDPSIRKPITVNMIDALQRGDTSQLPKLLSGDTVYVPRIETVTKETPRETITQPIPTPTSKAEEEKFVVNVMGAVASPNSFVFTEEPTLTQALMRAGGVTDSMALKSIRVIRNSATEENKVIYVDLDKYLKEGDNSILPKLYSGDTIYVPPVMQEKIKESSITITGEVTKPGSYAILEPVDILDAISMAGGLTLNADSEKIRVRRENNDSYQDKIVNINELLNDIRSSVPPEMVGQGYRIYVPTKERSIVITTASATRGIIVFLADLVPVYGLYRLIK